MGGVVHAKLHHFEYPQRFCVVLWQLHRLLGLVFRFIGRPPSSLSSSHI